ncbi:fibronectin/fibrinogen-binding protein [Alicyclobacillaceae bacterium I2511]|nr:fibronectin/fibrinogen-binding protein [Alicyclobacillaceae bacterium I2511]
MDGLTLAVLVRDWQRFVHSRIEKVHQPGDRDLVLALRHPGGSIRILLSAHRAAPRAHILFHTRPENPEHPPMFCMLLRKYLEGGEIYAIRQAPDWERVLQIYVQSRNELGDSTRYVLLLEIMGKHSNLLLCTLGTSEQPETVVDSIVHVTEHMSRVRPIFPGQTYTPVPPLTKKIVSHLTVQDLVELHLPELTEKQQIRAVVQIVAGVGPKTAHEALWRSQVEAAASQQNQASVLWHTLQNLWNRTLSGQEPPSLGLDKLGYPAAVAPFALTHWTRWQQVDSLDNALDSFYQNQTARLRESARTQSLLQTLEFHMDRLRGKQTKLQTQLEQSKEAENLRVQGELLITYAHQVHKGMQLVILPNFYEQESPLKIVLDPAQTAIENAQRFFRAAAKRKRAVPLVSTELERCTKDLQYLEHILLYTENASGQELEQLREELIKQEFITQKGRFSKQGRMQHKRKNSGNDMGKILTFLSSDGFPIRVGRNNLQNDQLTLKRSQPEDLWFHVKDAAGSHVILSTLHQTVPDQSLHEAALLAAYFSKLRTSSNAPVDYTLVRHVWKANGARPGMVLYDHQKSLWVTPEQSLLAPILARQQH